MKAVILFLVALVAGALCTLVAVNAMNRGTTWSHATMGVIGAQMKAMDASVKANRCAGTDLVPRLQTLRYVANDIEPAFPDLVGEPQFSRYAGDLRAAADAALANPPASCAAASTTLSSLKKSCDSCHRDFRG